MTELEYMQRETRAMEALTNILRTREVDNKDTLMRDAAVNVCQTLSIAIRQGLTPTEILEYAKADFETWVYHNEY